MKGEPGQISLAKIGDYVLIGDFKNDVSEVASARDTLDGVDACGIIRDVCDHGFTIVVTKVLHEPNVFCVCISSHIQLSYKSLSFPSKTVVSKNPNYWKITASVHQPDAKSLRSINQVCKYGEYVAGVRKDTGRLTIWGCGELVRHEFDIITVKMLFIIDAVKDEIQKIGYDWFVHDKPGAFLIIDEKLIFRMHNFFSVENTQAYIISNKK